MARKPAGKPGPGKEAKETALTRGTQASKALGLEPDSAGGYLVPKQLDGKVEPYAKKPKKKPR
jgi:hypothetical protein